LKPERGMSTQLTMKRVCGPLKESADHKRVHRTIWYTKSPWDYTKSTWYYKSVESVDHRSADY
jgi:7,8-dihydro-6-hydroxymethylpterin-pyrophosphokinase